MTTVYQVRASCNNKLTNTIWSEITNKDAKRIVLATIFDEVDELQHVSTVLVSVFYVYHKDHLVHVAETLEGAIEAFDEIELEE